MLSQFSKWVHTRSTFAGIRNLSATTIFMTLAACHVLEPQNKIFAACENECMSENGQKCDQHSCVRGCQFVSDRIVEGQSKAVLNCIKKRADCTDLAWAYCGAHVGHPADNGSSVASQKREN